MPGECSPSTSSGYSPFSILGAKEHCENIPYIIYRTWQGYLDQEVVLGPGVIDCYSCYHSCQKLIGWVWNKILTFASCDRTLLPPKKNLRHNFQHSYIRNHIAHYKPFSNDFRPNKSQFGDLVRLQAMLQACNYIVTMTNKNLGCAIITRQWFINGSQECLADHNSYVEVSPAERQVILEETVSNVRELADLVELAGLSEQLCKYLVSKCPKDETREPEIPQFYGIPKIHKQLVKFRPIVPCHSCVQAPAAKYVSKCLKPILERCKHVLKGTKQLAMDLAKANTSGKRVHAIISYGNLFM